jgi:hypothetical protein
MYHRFFLPSLKVKESMEFILTMVIFCQESCPFVLNKLTHGSQIHLSSQTIINLGKDFLTFKLYTFHIHT